MIQRVALVISLLLLANFVAALAVDPHGAAPGIAFMAYIASIAMAPLVAPRP